MSTLTILQHEVVEEARKRMAGMTWFRGCCLDNLPKDAEIMLDRQRSIERIEEETAYFDAPAFGANG